MVLICLEVSKIKKNCLSHLIINFLILALFQPTVNALNTNSLDNTLNNLAVTLPGVNSPYLYFGMWKATFPWHVEVTKYYYYV